MNILSAWKNAAYQQSLTAGVRAPLPVNLIGEVELTDADLEAIHGASGYDSGWLNGNNSHNNDNNHNINVLNGTSVLSGNNVLNGAVSNIGILGIGSYNSSNEESGYCHKCQ